jgi:chemosensory pili system protein ChpA (sensor histidine kinase/response regulator)
MQSQPQAEQPQRDELDQEIVDIFLEEAVDILDRQAKPFNAGSTIRKTRNRLSSLQRDLHTLKGGARMAEIGRWAIWA